jgi:hypothetical protein
MTDYVAISALVLSILSTLGGAFAYLHIKLNSNCCGCCSLELRERTPPNSPSMKLDSMDDIIKNKNSTIV